MKKILCPIGIIGLLSILLVSAFFMLFRSKSAASEPYQVLQKIRFIDGYGHLTLTQYHSQINEICNDYNTDIFKVYADVWDEMDTADPLYNFTATTLAYSVEQLYWETMQDEETPFVSFHAQKLVVDESELNDLKKTMSKEEFLNNEYDKYPPTSLAVFYDYNINFNITDASTTVAERDKALNNISDLVQNYVDMIDEDNYHTPSIEYELEEILAASVIQTSSEKIHLTSGDTVLEIF